MSPVDASSELEGIAPVELAERLARRDDLLLVDVREPDEWRLGHIAGARHVPLARLLDALPDLAAARDVVVYCRSGPRSVQAARTLREHGQTRVRVLDGGILRWSEDVDPSLPRY